jgi:hypothetical protein
LADFAADVDGRRGVTLPGWKAFGELVGTDEAARALFVDMQRCEAALLARIVREDSIEPDRGWEERLFRLYNWQVASGQRNAAPPLGSCATMLFLSCLPQTGGSARGAIGVAELAKRPPIREAVVGNQPQIAVRRLLLAWVNHCPVQNERVLGSRLELMSLYELREALPLALAVARGESPYLAATANSRVIATLVIGRFGSAEQANDLEPLLADDTVWTAVGPPGNARAVQVRDVALATMLHLTGQQPQDYGFTGAQRHPQLLFNPQSLGLADDAARAAAAAKWRAWKDAHVGRGD